MLCIQQFVLDSFLNFRLNSQPASQCAVCVLLIVFVIELTTQVNRSMWCSWWSYCRYTNKCLALFVATKPKLFDKQIIVQLQHTQTHTRARTRTHKALLLACGNINGVASTHRLLMCREGCQMANTSGWVRLPPVFLPPMLSVRSSLSSVCSGEVA